MALILPSAPKNFYEPSLNKIKTDMETVDTIIGQMVLITATPGDIETAWGELGVAADTLNGANRGTLVVGHKSIVSISTPIISTEEVPGETGYKVQIAPIENIPVYIDGSGTATTTIIGMAMVMGTPTFAGGTDSLLKYLFKGKDLLVTDGTLVDIPELEIHINYSEILIP